MSLAQQNYNVTEGNIVSITLHVSRSHEIDFTVTLQHMNGSATGESTACGGYVHMHVEGAFSDFFFHFMYDT